MKVKVSADGNNFEEYDDEIDVNTGKSLAREGLKQKGYTIYEDMTNDDGKSVYPVPENEVNEARGKGFKTLQEANIRKNATEDTVKKISSDTQKRFDNRESGFASEDAFLHGLADFATRGNADKLAVVGNKIAGGVRNVIGDKASDSLGLGDGNLTMEQQQDYSRDLAEANPGLTMAGNAVGILAETAGTGGTNLLGRVALSGADSAAREVSRQADDGKYDIGQIGEQALIGGGLGLAGEGVAAGLTKGVSAIAKGVGNLTKGGLSKVYGKEILPFLEDPKLLKLAQDAPEQIATELAKYDGLSKQLKEEIERGLKETADPRNAAYRELRSTTKEMLERKPPNAADIDTPEVAARKAMSAEEGTAAVEIIPPSKPQLPQGQQQLALEAPLSERPIANKIELAQRGGAIDEFDPSLIPPQKITATEIPPPFTEGDEVLGTQFRAPDFDATIPRTSGFKGSDQFDQGEQIRSAFSNARDSILKSPKLQGSNNYEIIAEKISKLRDPSDIKAMANALDVNKNADFKLLTEDDKNILNYVRENYLNTLPGDVRSSFDKASALYAAEKPRTDIIRSKLMTKLGGSKKEVDYDIIKKRLIAPEKMVNVRVREAVENIAPDAKVVYEQADAVRDRIMQQSAYKKQLDKLQSGVDPSAVGALRMVSPLAAAPASFSTAAAAIKAFDFASKFGDKTFAQLKYLYPQAIQGGQIVTRIANRFLAEKGLQPYPEDK